MYAHIMAEVSGITPETKGLVSKASHLKTKTKLELQFDKESRAQIDIFNGIRSDIQLLGIQAIPVTSVMLTVEGAPAVPDGACYYDTSLPTSDCTGAPYTTELPLNVRFSAADADTGIASVALWYR